MPPEKEGDVFDRALAPFNHDDYEDESCASESEVDDAMPSEKAGKTSSMSSSPRGSSSKSSSGSSSATPKRAQRRMSAR